MNFVIPSKNIDPSAFMTLFNKVDLIIKMGKGQVQLTELLSILNFPPETNEKIIQARGPVAVKCDNSTCTATNLGEKIKENLPGSAGTLGIIITQSFSCQFKMESKKKGYRTLIIDKIKGLHADLPGPFNPTVDKITLRMPDYVELQI